MLLALLFPLGFPFRVGKLLIAMALFKINCGWAVLARPKVFCSRVTVLRTTTEPLT